jgi:hypothetical protein
VAGALDGLNRTLWKVEANRRHSFDAADRIGRAEHHQRGSLDRAEGR